MEKRKKEQIKLWARRIFYTLLAATVLFSLVHWREQLFLLISSAEAREQYIVALRESGLKGIAVFLGLQILQILVAVIPGEPIEIMAGVLYGTLGGTIICLFGALLGSVLIYYFVKGIGNNPLKNEKHHKYRVLTDLQKAEVLLFLLFLLPGTPKDILLYFAPFLPVRPKNFFVLSTLARIPSVASSTFAGANLAQGDLGVTLAVFLVTGAAGLLGILYHQKLLDALGRHKAKRTAQHPEKPSAPPKA